MDADSRPPLAPGLVTKASAHSADGTIARLEEVVRRQGLTIFARIDHRANALDVDLEMPAALVLIFGSPRAGTPLMLAAPLIALDLPLRVLIWEDPHARVWATYNAPAGLAERYGIPPDLARAISGVEALVEAAVRP